MPRGVGIAIPKGFEVAMTAAAAKTAPPLPPPTRLSEIDDSDSSFPESLHRIEPGVTLLETKGKTPWTRI
tara:strand:+ start:132 stop:341 length:210 start_codon:yes stop_codon:yes gene_type:complete